MATTMEIAMAEAARKVQQATAQTKPMSLKQKIWRWIKDHPNCTNKAIAEAFGTTAANVAGTTSNLLARDMIIITGKVPPVPTRGSWFSPEANRFSVNPKMRGVYEQLPFVRGANAGMPSRKRRAEKVSEPPPSVQKAAPTTALVVEKPQQKEPAQMPAFDPEKIVNDLTFGEAMSLFRYLCKHLKVEP